MQAGASGPGSWPGYACWGQSPGTGGGPIDMRAARSLSRRPGLGRGSVLLRILEVSPFPAVRIQRWWLAVRRRLRHGRGRGQLQSGVDNFRRCRSRYFHLAERLVPCRLSELQQHASTRLRACDRRAACERPHYRVARYLELPSGRSEAH